MRDTCYGGKMASMSESAPADETPLATVAEAPSVQVFTLRRAAEVAGVSMSTLRRRKKDLEAQGALISEAGWQVPITALEAVGLIKTTRPDTVQESAESAGMPPREAEHALDGEALPKAEERIRELELEVIEQRHRAELAEVRLAAAEQRATAAEILAADRAETLKVERRMLMPGPSAYTPQPPQPQTSQETPATPSTPPQEPQDRAEVRPSWWKRTFG